MRAPLAALAAAAAAAFVTGCPSSHGSPLPLPPPDQLPAATTSHAVVLVMENKEYSNVMGSRDSDYVRSLAKSYAVPSKFYAIRHPSLPNYVALIGGDTFGISSDCTSCYVNHANLAAQLEKSHHTWKAYMEGMPHRCFTGSEHNRYAKKHDPFMYYDGIRKNPTRCNRIVPYKELGTDLKQGRLPDFAFISPDLCNDTHDCSIHTGDRFLAHLVPALLRELGPHGILFITWDEGDSDKGCCGVAHGGRIVTVVAGPDVAKGARGSRSYTQYSILRTIEEGFRLKPLRHAASAPRLDALFKRSTRGVLGH